MDAARQIKDHASAVAVGFIFWTCLKIRSQPRGSKKEASGEVCRGLLRMVYRMVYRLAAAPHSLSSSKCLPFKEKHAYLCKDVVTWACCFAQRFTCVWLRNSYSESLPKQLTVKVSI